MREELKIICSEDCGNAPKKEIIRDFTIAVARNNVELILDNVTENITWHIVGNKRYQGKDSYIEALGKLDNDKVTELRIDHILTHGKDGSSNGVVTYSNDKKHAFCNVYAFSSSAKHARIKEITSYIIELL